MQHTTVLKMFILGCFFGLFVSCSPQAEFCQKNQNTIDAVGVSNNDLSPAKPRWPQEAWVTSPEGLRVRSGPDTHYDVITVLPYGSFVQIYDEQETRYTIDGTSGTWVMIQSANILEAWLFGGFINCDLAQRPSLPFPLPSLQELVPGKWKSTRINGKGVYTDEVNSFLSSDGILTGPTFRLNSEEYQFMNNGELLVGDINAGFDDGTCAPHSSLVPSGRWHLFDNTLEMNLHGQSKVFNLCAESPYLLHLTSDDGQSMLLTRDEPLLYNSEGLDKEFVFWELYGRNILDQSFAQEATALMIALEHRDVQMVNLLLDWGAAINGADHLGRSPLHLAVYYAADKSALQRNSRYEYDIYDPWNKVLARLIELGADLCATDDLGQTPLDYLVLNDNKKLYRPRRQILYAAGAPVSQACWAEELQLVDNLDVPPPLLESHVTGVFN